MRGHSGNSFAMSGSQSSRGLHKLLLCLILFVSFTYIVYMLKLLSVTRPCIEEAITSHRRLDDLYMPSKPNTTNGTATTSTIITPKKNRTTTLPKRNQMTNLTTTIRTTKHRQPNNNRTQLKHVVFGIAASANLWEQRKEYIKVWYKPKQMRAIVWLDEKVKHNKSEGLPPIKISEDTAQFPYKNKQGHRSAIRISRIVSETLRLGMRNVRWFIMGDDDTVFITDNLLRVLNKFDHNQYWYIGSLSESHLQNIFFSYGMAYGGGGFAISYPLAKAISKMQDRCITRYPGLYGSDDRMQACMAELGVPLTKHNGFHQFDVYGNLLGLLSAHPVTPLISLHHLDIVEPIFPTLNRVQSLNHLMEPMRLDSASLIQQSICYDKARGWTVSVSWGFIVQVFRGIFSPREMEMPARTFLNWYRRADYTAYPFNTRPVSRHHCQKPFMFYMSRAGFNTTLNTTLTRYDRHPIHYPHCKWKVPNPGGIDTILVYKKPDPQLWDRSPRRNCCRVLNLKKKGKLIIDVGVCRDDEVTEI